jgi:hypothetical protein
VLTVSYDFEFEYPYDPAGRRFPYLTLTVSRPGLSEQATDVDAFIDTGAEASLFNGEVASVIGVDLLSGEPKEFQSSAGPRVEARVHRVCLDHDQLGQFEIRLAFSTGRLYRNLLGRDFLNLVQVGIRERQQRFFLSPRP